MTPNAEFLAFCRLAALCVAAIGCTGDDTPAAQAPPNGASSVAASSTSASSTGAGADAGGGGSSAGGSGAGGTVATGGGGASDPKMDAAGTGGVAVVDADAWPPDDGAVGSGDTGTPMPPFDAREEKNFACTLVLGAFQTSQWYDAGFETAVGTERWEIKSAHNNWTEKWADPANPIWNLPTVSPCTMGAMSPDRVLLVVYKDFYAPAPAPAVWASEITQDVQNIKTKYPGVRRIELLTLARAPNNQACPGNTSRNIVVSPDIDNAIDMVAAASGGLVGAGPKYYVPDCSMFMTNTTTLIDGAGARVAPQLIDHYKMHQ